MTETSTPSRSGALSAIVGMVLNLVVFISLSLVVSVVVEWILMGFWFEEASAAHSRHMVEHELRYVHQDFRETLFVRDAPALLGELHAFVYVGLAERTGLTQLVANVRANSEAVLAPISEYLLATVYMIHLYTIRLTILVLALPVFVLCAVCGLIKGMNERDLRRWGAAREVSDIYHISRKMIMPVITLPFVVYLSIPQAVHPTVIILPFALALGFIVYFAASRFKKYFLD